MSRTATPYRLTVTRRRGRCAACDRPGREVNVGGEALALCSDHELQARLAHRAAAATVRPEPARGSGVPKVTTRRFKR